MMRIKLFDITESSSQLVVTKRKLPRILPFLFGCPLAVFFAYTISDMLDQSLDFWAVFGLIIATFLFAAIASQLRRDVCTFVQGETWTFDIDRSIVERNGKWIGDLSQMYSIRAWEEGTGEDAMQRLAIQPMGARPLIISDALSDGNWDELVSTARQISDFTGIKVVYK